MKVTIQFDIMIIMITIEKPSEDSVIRIFPDFLSIFEQKKESLSLFSSQCTPQLDTSPVEAAIT